jgi:hypothetical protein
VASRTLSSATITAIQQDVVNHFFAVSVVILDANNAEQTVRVWTGIGDKTIDNEVYTGAGTMLNISGIDETQDFAMNGITIGLTMDSDFLLNFTSKEYQGKEVEVKLVFADTAGAVLGSMLYFQGFTDLISYKQGKDTSVLALKAENKLLKFGKSASLFYTAEGQKRFYPTDQGFDSVTTIQDQNLTWGA